jgi:hypothetical protein
VLRVLSLNVEECAALVVDHLLRNAAAWTHHGRAVQVDPIKLTVKALGSKRLKL